MENHEQMPWHSQTIQEVLENLDSSEDGLSDLEAKNRLIKNGANELRKKPNRTLLQMIYSQLIDPMVLILIFATILSFVLGEIVEGSVILFIIILNTLISIIQEKKAESSLEALKNMSAPNAIALRQGEESIIPAKDLVIGDIVFLEDGSIVPADIRLIQSYNLKVQESSLTGESTSSEKDSEDILPKSCPIGDRTNMLYSSSIITYGRCIGVVVDTGMDTEVGKIAKSLDSEENDDTPLKRKLAYVGKILTIIGIVVCILIIIIGLLYDRPLIPMLMIAISLAISIIPEGLPATATIIMAIGIQHMAKKNALIRKLPAVETLGSTTVICSDKTGTLTLNKMTVTHIFSSTNLNNSRITSMNDIDEKDLPEYKDIVFASALCNNANLNPDKENGILGDPTEGALIFMAKHFGINQDEFEENHNRVYEQPFDSDRKLMTTVSNIDGILVSYTKGAIDELLPLCTNILDSNGIRKITDKDCELIHSLCSSMSSKALRVLGFAKSTLKDIPKEGDNIENNLTFIGAIGMIDPPRKEVKKSIETCKRAGIRTIMITGDHKTTAVAIAKELGIFSNGDKAISGDELELMSDDKLDKLVNQTTVFARVSPNDKLRIIKSLKRNGEIAAMTGDGVNDSPALKAADIGVAMGVNGTDVAKDSADMILLDDNFTTIAYAMKEGRRIYRNIQKVIQFLLVGNIAEILTLFIATLFNWDMPLLGVHILWVNLATATLPALALGVDPASKNIMNSPPVKSGTLLERKLIINVLTQGIFVSLLTISAYIIGIKYFDYATGQTMAFCVLAFSQMLRSFSQHSNTESMFSRNKAHNPYLFLSFIISGLLMMAILFIPTLKSIFSLTSLSIQNWLIILLLSLLSVIQVELFKLIKRK